MDDCGIIVLKDAVNQIIAEELSISANEYEITTDNGTLQFTADISQGNNDRNSSTH